MKDRDSFDNWYKSKLESGNESPPEDSWDNISNKLDVNSVWDNVSSQLNDIEDKRKKRRGFVYFLFLGTLFLLGYLIFVDVNSKVSESSQITESNNQSITPALNTLTNISTGKANEQHILQSVSVQALQGPTNNSIINNSLANNKVSFHRKRNSSVINKTQENSNEFKNEVISSQDVNTVLPDTIEIEKELWSHFYLPMKPLQFAVVDPLADVKLNFDTTSDLHQLAIKPKLSGFYIGTLFSGQNPWLWNAQTLNGLSKNSLNQTIPKFGYSYGVSLGYYHSGGWSLQSDLLFDSQYGQSYAGYKEGVYVMEKINLHYYQMNLYTVKRVDTELKNKNLIVSSGPLIGLNLRYLNSASKETNMANEQIANQYSKFDFGLLMGYEWDITIKRRYMLFSSVSGDFGLYNIYSGSRSEPKAFNKTFNSSLRLGVGIKYLFSK